MRRHYILSAVALLLAATGAVFWWFAPAPMPSSTAQGGRILYYQDPSGAPDYSATPKNDAKGRPFVAVRETESTLPHPADAHSDARKILYYRNPMGLADTSPVPKKDSMGMDYIPVYADDNAAPGAVRLSLDKVQRLGVRTEPVMRKALSESVVLTGTVAADERAQSMVTLRFKAHIVKVHVASTGEHVRVGQPLFDVHSPFLLQEEVTLALDLKTRDVSQQLGGVYAQSNASAAAIARKRLELYDVPESEIQRLIRTKEPTGHVTWLATHAGTVMEKPIVEGMHAEEGEPLYRITDLSTVWVIAQAPEQALSMTKPGARASITFAAYPGQHFDGKVTFVYPEVDMATRTAKVRIELANPDGVLMPGLFASVTLSSPAGAPVLTVPESAIIDSGRRQVVLLSRDEGLFEPRAVTVGRRADGNVEILGGLSEGDKVVTSATFLIDAESNLRTALQGFTGEGSAKP